MLALLTNYGINSLDDLSQDQNINDDDASLNAFLESKIEENADEVIKEGMNINEITEIVSDKIIDLIKKQLNKE
jgi:hypothetical protein